MKVIRQEELDKQPTPQPNKGFEMLPQIEVTQLPSGFLSYPKGVKIQYRPYVFGEIKKFNQSNQSKLDTYQMALDGVSVTGMPIDSLTFPDVIYIALLRKISSLGDTSFSLSYKCRYCDKTNTVSINHTNVGFTDMEIKELPIVATLSNGTELEFGLFTFANYKALQEKTRSNPTINEDMYAMALTVQNMSADDAYQAIYNSTLKDGAILDYVDHLQYHNVAPLTLKCEGCKHGNKVRLTGGDVLIGPFRESPEYVKSRVRTGVQDASKRP